MFFLHSWCKRNVYSLFGRASTTPTLSCAFWHKGTTPLPGGGEKRMTPWHTGLLWNVQQNTHAKDLVASSLATKHLYSLHKFDWPASLLLFFLSHQFQETHATPTAKKTRVKQGEKVLYHIICCDRDFYAVFPEPIFLPLNCSLPSPLKKKKKKKNTRKGRDIKTIADYTFIPPSEGGRETSNCTIMFAKGRTPHSWFVFKEMQLLLTSKNQQWKNTDNNVRMNV